MRVRQESDESPARVWQEFLVENNGIFTHSANWIFHHKNASKVSSTPKKNKKQNRIPVS